MRTTVTLDPDVEALIKAAMRERSLSFKEALNAAVRDGAVSPLQQPVVPSVTYDMGEPLVDVTKALRLAGELEDQERAARLAVGD